MADKYWLSFTLGPVQSFISTARTVRDLWMGSYLLSWLTAHAAKTVRELNGNFVEPEIMENPMFRFLLDGTKGDPDGLLTPTLPNRFISEVDGEHAKNLPALVEDTVQREWRKLADKVRDFLKERWNGEYPEWDAHWDDQIGNCWDVRVSVLPVSEKDIEIARGLGFSLKDSVDDASLFKARMFLLGRLDAANKQIRHYPPHEPNSCHRPKCTLCGERAQQIPQEHQNWEEATKLIADGGERLSLKDRFCAVGLLKRFTWAHYFSRQDCFDCKPHERRIWDTYTISASGWLAERLLVQDSGAARLHEWLNERAKDAHERNSTWNGQWLFWRDPDPPGRDKDEVGPCPDVVWEEIKKVRKRASGNPPSYYAILMLDGDEMGKKLRNADRAGQQSISRKLADFAMEEVTEIVRERLGQLIYAGGDDVLAMLPRETALDCAHVLNQKFKGYLHDFTLSGGIAVVHVKHDLRSALEIARNAEKKAKDSGRNRLALSIVKRSGEPETAIIRWGHIPQLEKLRERFADPGVSDRWMFHLAAEWNVLEQDHHLLDVEFARLLHRNDRALKEEAIVFWKAFAKDPIEQRRNALTLMQSASFLARAKED
jgi:CRISPR-associated protein Cmr2